MKNSRLSCVERRDLGHMLLVFAGQLAAVAVALGCWVGKDLAYAPGWTHPIGFYLALDATLILLLALAGFLLLRREQSAS